MEVRTEPRASRGRFRWRRFGWALAASLLVHIGYVIPNLIAPIVSMSGRKEEVEVAFLPDPDSAPSDPLAALEPEPEKAQQEKAKPEPKLEKPPEPAQLPEPKPTPPPPVVQQQPPPPPPPLDKRKQMVTQDRFPEEEDNADAKYLAEKNHRTTEDTRAENTNLIREAQGVDHKSAPNQNQDKNPGEEDHKIAQLEQHTGTDLPRSSPQVGKEGQSQDRRQSQPGPLAMRNLVPRNSERAEAQQRDGVERQEQSAGELPMQRKGQDGQRGGATKKGGDVKLSLDHHAYDNIEGFSTAENERRQAAKAEHSHVRGRYDRYLDKVAVMKSAIENFTPDVKIGNQAELGTRASPFAGYIAAMHRQIHSIWTFGFLADQDKRTGKGAFDDETLWTQVQITLKGDGTVDKLGVVRSSGNVAFDAAALDSVMSAAPFPKPPAVIKSANGKVYMDWQFHRDERACGTFGVDPHILTTPGEDVAHDTSETGAGLPRVARAGKGGANGAALGAAPPASEEGLRRLQREAPGRKASEPEEPVPAITDQVRTTADGWFAAWARGDVTWLTGWSAVPFLANGQVSARTPDQLRTMYKQMVAETSTRKLAGDVEVLTPGGIRGKSGGLPPGGQEGGMLFAVGEVGGEKFVLLLRNSDHGWRVAGLVR